MAALTLTSIVDAITSTSTSHPLRVGIDGCCAAGKTTLATQLAAALAELGRSVIRACTDDFQNPAESTKMSI